ncbi:U3 snoRNP protein [Blyttiomyces sp. JEL0837]|nr:U3 snoRNP protein [Blyttiomyces sp. JEL0837]
MSDIFNIPILLYSPNTSTSSFCRALQLHPTKPSMWIMAARWEFEEMNNMTSARVLMQRAIRLNKDSRLLWHEYFKLELLWIEKIKERRRILFGQGARNADGGELVLSPRQQQQQQQKLDEAEESRKRREEAEKAGLADRDRDEDEDDLDGMDVDGPINLPKLQEEAGIEESQLDGDATIRSWTEGSQDPAMMMGKNLTPMQRALLEVAIPRAIYRNAIKAFPSDLEFRLGFLKLYQTFGEDTKIGQEEVITSLKTDFGTDPQAVGAITERRLANLSTSDPMFPAALKAVVDEYESHLVARNV